MTSASRFTPILRMALWCAVCLACALSAGWWLLEAPAIPLVLFIALVVLALVAAAVLLRLSLAAVLYGLLATVAGCIAAVWAASYIVTHHFS